MKGATKLLLALISAAITGVATSAIAEAGIALNHNETLVSGSDS